MFRPCRRESKTIDLALLILRATFENRYDRPDRTPGIRLALRVLLPYVDRAHLLSFWAILENENPLQRLNNLRKTYAVIEACAVGQRHRTSAKAG